MVLTEGVYFFIINLVVDFIIRTFASAEAKSRLGGDKLGFSKGSCLVILQKEISKNNKKKFGCFKLSLYICTR
jgi:hypothetical protein